MDRPKRIRINYRNQEPQVPGVDLSDPNIRVIPRKHITHCEFSEGTKTYRKTFSVIHCYELCIVKGTVFAILALYSDLRYGKGLDANRTICTITSTGDVSPVLIVDGDKEAIYAIFSWHDILHVLMRNGWVEQVQLDGTRTKIACIDEIMVTPTLFIAWGDYMILQTHELVVYDKGWTKVMKLNCDVGYNTSVVHNGMFCASSDKVHPSICIWRSLGTPRKLIGYHTYQITGLVSTGSFLFSGKFFSIP